MSSKFIVFVDVTSAISFESNFPNFDCNELNIELYVLSDAISTDLKFILAGWSYGNLFISSDNKFVLPLLLAALTNSAQLAKFCSSGGLAANK